MSFPHAPFADPGRCSPCKPMWVHPAPCHRSRPAEKKIDPQVAARILKNGEVRFQKWIGLYIYYIIYIYMCIYIYNT